MEFILKLIVESILAYVTTANSQVYPGTPNRPILSDSEVARFTESNYLQGWVVKNISIPSIPDYVVGAGQDYTDIQAAVNAAINEGGPVRKYIQIQPGTYGQTVYVTGSVPLTIYGSGSSPSDVVIMLSQPADMNVSAWINQVNPGGSRYKPGDPAYNIYNKCASTTNAAIGGSCSSIFWITASDVEVCNLQVTNFYSSNGVAQSVALKTDADKIRLSNLNLISRQDTLYAGSGKAGAIQRVYVDNSYIEGDIDFVFGGASAIFTGVTFKAVGDRHPSGAYVFAPNTDPGNSYGFLVKRSVITGDSIFQSSKKGGLARAWDTGVSSGKYIPGTSPNGQLVIRECQIDAFLDVSMPYGAAATSARAYEGDAAISRDLDDNNYNRFWEYDNYGHGV